LAEALLARAEVMSGGIIKGDEPAALRSTVPSPVITSSLLAKKMRLYITFSAISECDHMGMLDMSMLLPHDDATLLPAVWLFVYDHMAATLESFAAMEDIMLPTDIAPPAAEGGLIIPNMPF
jgi:hypothetical protein